MEARTKDSSKSSKKFTKTKVGCRLTIIRDVNYSNNQVTVLSEHISLSDCFIRVHQFVAYRCCTSYTKYEFKYK